MSRHLRAIGPSVIALMLVACTGQAGQTSVASAPPTLSSVASAQPTAVPSTASLEPSSPVTPEPEGLLLVAIGDSIPFGKQDCDGCTPFPELYGDWIAAESGMPVRVSNLATHDNLTTPRLVGRLSSTLFRDALRQADIITVTIGHNDTPWNATDDGCDGSNGFFDGNDQAPWDVLVGPCLDVEVARYRAGLETVFDTIDELRAGKPTLIQFTTQYGDIPGDRCCPPEATDVSVTIKDAFNNAACDVAAAHEVPCIDVYHAFNGPDGRGDAGALLAGDHTHPSALGQRKIAELLEATGLGPLK